MQPQINSVARTNRMHVHQCIFLLLLHLLVSLVVPTIGAAVPLPPVSTNVAATATFVSPTLTTPIPTIKVTAQVRFISDAGTQIDSGVTSVGQWQMDAKLAVRRMLDLALALAVGNPTNPRSGGTPKTKVNLDLQSWGQGSAPSSKFGFEVTVSAWPGKTGFRHLWGWRKSTLKGDVELTPLSSDHCNDHCEHHGRYKIQSGTLNDESTKKRLVTVANDRVVNNPIGMDNTDIPLGSLPPPATPDLSKNKKAQVRMLFSCCLGERTFTDLMPMYTPRVNSETSHMHNKREEDDEADQAGVGGR
ncbi:hypothetical protein F5878DRAFT_659107 [Lentinula raphanica]|uniref:Uncharacterized protein n=1 Tax=Lentinula raphanica TaxID=153919 RepID=A0AA38PDP4_9AGAR|nr:hypothetical protein F5878DRAFT_659107 [Lentinula raphanica]